MEANEALLERREDTQHGRYLAFDEEIFGLEIKYVTEIVGMQPITKIPEVAVIDTQDMIAGLIADKEVLSVEDQDMGPPPDRKTGMRNRYIQGIGKVDGNVKMLLDSKCFLKNPWKSDRFNKKPGNATIKICLH